MPKEFHIDTAQPEEGVVVASPIGEVDLASSPALRNRLGEIISEAPKRLIIDLTGAIFLSSLLASNAVKLIFVLAACSPLVVLLHIRSCMS